MSAKDDEYIQSLRKDFFDEAFEMIERLEENILVLEKDHNDMAAVSEIFRAVHTLKGSAGAVDLTPIASYAHHFEDLLDSLREKKISVDADTVDILLKGIDVLKEMIHTANDGKDIVRDSKADCAVLEEFKSARLAAGSGAPVAERKIDTAAHEKRAVPIDDAARAKMNACIEKGAHIYRVHVSFLADSLMKTVGGVQVYVALKEIGTLIDSNPPLKELETDTFYPHVTYLVCCDRSADDVSRYCAIADVTEHILVEEDSAAVVDAASPTDTGEKKDKDAKRQASYLRVENERIDEMLNQVGELVINKSSYQRYDEGFAASLDQVNIASNQFKAFFREMMNDFLSRLDGVVDKKTAKELKIAYSQRLNEMLKQMSSAGVSLKTIVDRFRSSYQMLARVTNELQETVMKIRMVPISQIFNRFPRLVRDLSRELGKEIELVMIGEDTELDKSVIEMLVDPLIHLVRNSIDHGIEPAAVRTAMGKKAAGTLTLSASHEGNFIVVKIIDDGKGIDLDKVRQSAVHAGFIAEDARLSEKETIDLIFNAGLSTAEKVTSVSGRGVGMDVVKQSIDKINGSIGVETARGQGSVFTLRIPLTLAIIEALVIEASGEFYSIPVGSIVETMRITNADFINVEGMNVIDLRGEYISAVALRDIFNIGARKTIVESETMYAVIIMFEDKKVALIVDNLLGEQDIVIKALRDRISNARGVAGATILGDGTISFILDVQMLVELGARRVLADRMKVSANG
ncbi:MAG: chemotaxis protein CheA [Spirochaetota bacterium]